jgi:hypothetical protein
MVVLALIFRNFHTEFHVVALLYILTDSVSSPAFVVASFFDDSHAFWGEMESQCHLNIIITICLSLSLSLSHIHTHTHTHTQPRGKEVLCICKPKKLQRLPVNHQKGREKSLEWILSH